METKETKEVVIITWKSGVKEIYCKTQATFDMIVYQFPEIQDLEFVDMIVEVYKK